MTHPLVEYYRCPDHLAVVETAEGLPAEPRYFRLGHGLAYGRHRPPDRAQAVDGPVEVSDGVVVQGDRLVTPFDLAEAVDNLRGERYPEALTAIADLSRVSLKRLAYYGVRPILTVGVRKHLQRLHWRGWEQISFPRWPVDTSVEAVMRRVVGLALEHGAVGEFPFIWFWPDGASSCVMMTHDVEGAAGADACDRLMDADAAHGVPSSFQVVPEAPWSTRTRTRSLVGRMRARGFEVNVHDLSHDGTLFRNRDRFLRHAATINARGREFGSRGFRSGAMYRRQDWFSALDISYDMSVPNVAHLEPQRGGCCTVMPYFNGHVLELPLTTSQDYTLFNVLGRHDTGLWQQQIDAILREHGLLSFIAHPDYLLDERAWGVYLQLLGMLQGLRDEHGAWMAAPADVDRWWRERQEMSLVHEDGEWTVTGAGSERARVAWARLDEGRVVYDVSPARRAA
ncbi:hypothetical protein TBR22_A53150 [Luteitalea sp. TBR-22]|uniref:hypothetical protein n=1 Tax=Luteitalea sp. TBR-22 TaxID=2802971 RepID=UPI001AF6127B|nr:hypothetical protein [Luteitalea sp. TBR-22]BCS36078.1 hypothetical protein TBR22_A53150 [Luteitalea sp. TBR-22]